MPSLDLSQIEKKDKELECLREGNYYDEFSDETHHSRQNRYRKENNELCSEIEELCKTVLKYQGDLEDRMRSCNAAEDELAKQRKTLRRYESIMETQRVDLGTYKNNLGRLESKYDDVSAQLDEANIEIVEREAGIENAGGAIFDLRAQIDRLNGELAEAESSSTKAEAERDCIQLL